MPPENIKERLLFVEINDSGPLHKPNEIISPKKQIKWITILLYLID